MDIADRQVHLLVRLQTFFIAEGSVALGPITIVHHPFRSPDLGRGGRRRVVFDRRQRFRLGRRRRLGRQQRLGRRRRRLGHGRRRLLGLSSQRLI
jgi:hypothetical protein